MTSPDRNSLSHWNAIVFFVWICMFVVALWYVYDFGSPIPTGDDWANVPYVIGKRPITFQWLWGLHNEHRIPLPRLVYVAAIRSAGDDFRAGMFLNVILLAVIALLFLLMIRKIRGSMAPQDLFFPLCLLSLGHFENLLWSFQLAFVISAFLFSLVMIQVAQLTEENCGRRILPISAMTLLLPLCGGPGLMLAPPLIVWLLIQGLRFRKSKAAKATLVIAALAAVVCFLYITGVRPDQKFLAHEPSHWIRAAIDFLSTCFGPIRVIPLAVLILILMLLSVVYLLRNRKKGDPRVFGLMTCMAALFLLTAGIAIGRGGQSGAAASWRYMTLTAPILCGLYVIFTLYGRSITRYVPSLLMLIMAVLLPFHIRDALAYGSARTTQYLAFEQDVLKGFPDKALAARNMNVIFPRFEPVLPEWIGWLREAKIGPFAHQQQPSWQIAGAFKEERVVLPEEENPATQTYLAFAFPQPRFVEGIQFTFIRVFPKEREQLLRLFWGDSRQRRGHVIEMPTFSTPDAQAQTVWVYDTIDRIRIDGRAPQFKLLGLALLTSKK